MVAYQEKTDIHGVVDWEKKKKTGQQPLTRKIPRKKTLAKSVNSAEVGRIIKSQKGSF